jgi:thymidylate kinase
LDFFERVRKGYLNLAKEDEHLVVIEGKMDKEKIAQIVWSKVAEKAANLIK